MNRSNRRKIVWITLTALLTVLVFAACSNNSANPSDHAARESEAVKGEPAKDESAEPAQPGGKLSDTPVAFRWLVADRREAPVRDDWPIFEEIFNKTNVKIAWEKVADGLNEKRQILIATNSVTDFMQTSLVDVRLYGVDGVFLNLKDYWDVAPNIRNYFEVEHPGAAAVVTGADGGIYAVPIHAGSDIGSSWIVRQDILDELGIAPPNNADDFYTMLKTIKQAHPDTFPLLSYGVDFNNGSNTLTMLIRTFTGMEGYLQLEPESGQYLFAADLPAYRDAIEYLHKLHREKLLDPEFAIITEAQWEERILSGKTFISSGDKSRVEAFQNVAEESNLIPGFDMYAFPPFAEEGVKNYLYSRQAIATEGIAISNQVANKEIAVKFLDYLLSEEGSNYLALGLEGVTYEYVDGQPKFLEELGPAPYAWLRGEHGVWYPGVNIDMGKSRAAEVFSDKKQAIEDMYNPLKIIAPPALVLTDEENETEKMLRGNLNQYIEQSLTEFIVGRTEINDANWTQFLNQTIALGAHRLRDMYNEAYQRSYGSR